MQAPPERLRRASEAFAKPNIFAQEVLLCFVSFPLNEGKSRTHIFAERDEKCHEETIVPFDHPIGPTLLSVAVLALSLLIVATSRWTSLLIQAYKQVGEHFNNKAVSYSALMRNHTNRGLQVIVADADQQKPKGGSNSALISEKQMRLRRDALALPSAVGEASITSALMLQDLLAVDSHFYAAMSSMAGHQIASFADLHEQVSHYATNGLGEISSHVLDNVQGHLAEQFVAEHLRHLGHHVEMAATSNQSGWDMVVDHAFRINVKDYAHPSNFGDHFQHSPDVAIVVPHALSSTPADFDASSGLDHLHHAFTAHQSVISDGGLDHDAVVGHAHHALDAAHGHVPLHFPLITVGLSGWREANLLLDGSTHLARSAANVALDAAGTGIGGFAGHATGALIGTAIFPGVGTLIGGFLDAIAGGMGGRAVTNNIKEAPLREARDAYFASRDQTQSLMDRTRRAAEAQYGNYVSQSNRLLASEADRQNQQISTLRLTCDQRLLQSASFSEQEIAEFTAEVRTRLHEERQQAEHQVLQSWRTFKALWPDQHFVTNYVRYRFTNARNRQFAQRFIQIESSSISAPVRTAAYLQVCLSLGYGLEKAKQHFERIERQSFASRVQLSKMIDQAKGRLLLVRAEQVGILQRRTQEIAREMEDAVKGAVEQLKEREAALQKELKAFGRA